MVSYAFTLYFITYAARMSTHTQNLLNTLKYKGWNLQSLLQYCVPPNVKFEGGGESQCTL